MKKGLLYVHGKGGSAQEAEHYKPLFPEYDVVGLDYHSRTPWEARGEFRRFFDSFAAPHDDIILIANSMGAFFAMHALNDKPIAKAYFISPIVDMEALIAGMMARAGVTEGELREKGAIETAFGETLSWDYLSWVRAHPVSWGAPTSILCGAKDNLQSTETIRAFAAQIGADITVMENGEHWFHTEEQTAFLDGWLRRVQIG
ncbi:MAG: alpha/beta hydrolase [Oscillibacter sp.]|nr:alpha/beta hydrolase [Oscillibacter sp.]